MIAISCENSARRFVSSVRHRRIRVSQGIRLGRALSVDYWSHRPSLDKAESLVPLGCGLLVRLVLTGAGFPAVACLHHRALKSARLLGLVVIPAGNCLLFSFTETRLELFMWYSLAIRVEFGGVCGRGSQHKMGVSHAIIVRREFR
jgi:hypothetical protein